MPSTSLRSVQSKPETILQEVWVPWSEEVLSKQHSDKYTVPRGFQDVVGSMTSDPRTRALECYELGLLKGRLVNSQANIQAISAGWQLIQNNHSVHTKLGFLAYAVAKAKTKISHGPSILSAFSALCTIFLLQSSIEFDNKSFLAIAVFNHVLETFTCPIGINENDWMRYIASAFVSALENEQSTRHLMERYIHQKPVQTLEVSVGDTSRPQIVHVRPANLVDEMSRILGRDQLVPRRRTNYWYGSGTNSPGLYMCAAKEGLSLLAEATRLERQFLPNDTFSPLFRKPDTGLAPCVIEEAGKIFRQDHQAFEEWQALMKTLYEGVIDSLQYISSSYLDHDTQVLFAHNPDTDELPDPPFLIEVPFDQTAQKPLKNGRIVIHGQTFIVNNVQTENNLYRILVK